MKTGTWAGFISFWGLSLFLAYWAGTKKPTETLPKAAPLSGATTTSLSSASLLGNAPAEGQPSSTSNSSRAAPSNSKEKLADLLESPSGFKRNDQLIIALRNLTSPTEAFELASSISEPLLRYEAQTAVIKEWSGHQPSEAHAFLQKQNLTNLPLGGMEALFEGLKEAPDPSTVFAFAEALGETEAPYTYKLYQALQAQYRKEESTFTEWTEGLTDPSLKDLAIYSVIDQLGRVDPLAAKTWMEAHLSDANYLESHNELAESWARVDPESAFAWSLDIEDPSTQISAIDRIFKRWVEIDIEAAAHFLEQQGANPLMDRPIQRYLRRIAETDLEGSMLWAEEIVDHREQLNAMRRIADVWKRKDRDVLNQWLDNAPFNEEKKRQILRK